AQSDQYLDVADVAAFLEIGAHDSIHDDCLAAGTSRMDPQTVSSAGIGHALDQIESKFNAARLALALELSLRLRHALRGADSSGKVGRSISARGREIGIQLERAPGHARLILGAGCHRELEAPFAEIAPRANGVRID